MSTAIFVLGKIVGFFLQVENWLVIGLIALVILLVRQNWRAAKALGVSLLFFTLMVGFLPLGDALLRPLETRFARPAALNDVAGFILLGGPEKRRLSDEWGVAATGDSAERILDAIKLAREFPEAKILVTSGVNTVSGQNVDGAKGADILAQILIEQGIAPARLVIEPNARNTADNAQMAKDALSGAPVGNWVLITSAYHMPRAMRSFENAGWEGLIAWPTDYRSLPFWQNIRWDFLGHVFLLDLALHDWVGIWSYRIMGR